MGRKALREVLIFRGFATPYLKFPSSFRKDFPLSTDEMPDPVSVFIERKRNKVILTYEWEESELNAGNN